jgi:SAM-dependent methyltransferase
LNLDELLAEGGVKACCAALYESPAVRWFLGDELHPGGEEATRRSLELIEVRAGERILDLGSGPGTSALLAAREFGCLVAGVDYGAEAVSGAQRAAEAEGLYDRVGFVVGEAEALPFGNGEFDAVLCECSLSTFSDKERVIAEMRRVLRPGGRVAISDVIADRGRLPEDLRGVIATLACVGGALPLENYERLLAERELRTFAIEPLDTDAARLAERLEDRLRAARILDRCRESEEWCPFGFDQALAAVRLARRAIDEGALGYAIFAARS